METPVQVTLNESARRWEARVDDALAGYAEFRMVPGRVIFTHTVVEPQFEGRGIATALARAAVNDALARGLRITPYCPFVRAYLQRHPELAASVDYPKTR